VIVAPLALRAQLERLIEREIGCARSGEAGHIVLKVNALADRDVITQLYRASQAGVRIDLLVRGICALRAGVAGVSDNITVSSIVGRFLEHSRVWWFRNGGRSEAFVGSADLLPRNLNRRIEVMTRVADDALALRLRHEILGAYLDDRARVHRLQPDGSYADTGKNGTRAIDIQASLLDAAAERQVNR
jgi:polyphosphate kinase